MIFSNSTSLDNRRLAALLLQNTHPYPHETLRVRIRHSRGAPFSGRCFYLEPRILVNLGRRNRYPYSLTTHVAKARAHRRGWSRDTFRLTVADPYQLVLFVYLHELYHYLVKLSGRSPRRKEAMCDRFATRVMVDCYHCPVLTASGQPVSRSQWDFQDLTGFVAGAELPQPVAQAARRPIPVLVRGLFDDLETDRMGTAV